MNATGFPIFARAVTPGETQFIGWLLLVLGLGGLGMALRKWNWLQEHFAWLLRWGKGSWSIPASRVGVIYGFATASVIGMLCVSDAMNWWPLGDRDYFAVGFIFWLLLGVGVFLRDYFRHLNLKDD